MMRPVTARAARALRERRAEKLFGSSKSFWLAVRRFARPLDQGKRDRRCGGLNTKETNMIIGNFIYDKETDTFAGSITTLTVSHDEIRIRPTDKKNDKEPDYRVTSESDFGTIEFGAAWKRTSDRGQAFLSVAFDDPSLAGPINAALFLDADENNATLVWSRRKNGADKAPASAKAEASAKSKRLKAA
jgi:uncharacterized protein (DUF736 family)